MYELNVEGMTCNHCVGRVTRAIKELDSGANVEIDLAAKLARVESSTPVAQVAEALTDAGYPASPRQ